MAALSLSIDQIKPLNRWDYSSIRPGVVGSVGDVHVTPRYKHSSPNLPIRWDPYFSGKNSIFLGSNVNNGTVASYDSGGGPARTIDSNWGGRRHFKIRNGWVYQDLRAPDKLVSPVLGETPDYSWHNKIATNYEAKRTGEKFLPLPGPYIPSPGEVTRGGAFPYTRDYNPGHPPGSIVERGGLPGLQNIDSIVHREANARDYERSTVGRIPNFKPKKA